MRIDRDAIVAAVQGALEPLDAVQSYFEAGSAAFGNLDQWSDLDLMADVVEGHEDEAFAAVEAALTRLAPIGRRWVLPTPAWHGMAQRFYWLAGTPEHLLVDLCFRPASKPELFMERQLHGEPVVYFDKRGLVHSRSIDPEAVRAEIGRRLDTLRLTVPLFRHMVPKELARGRPLDATAAYQSLTLRPLVEVLRMRYCPARWNFGLRYAWRDLPPEVAGRLEPLAFVGDVDELAAKHAMAHEWCVAELANLDPDTLAL